MEPISKLELDRPLGTWGALKDRWVPHDVRDDVVDFVDGWSRKTQIANCANYPPVLKAVGLYFSQAIIWVKEHPAGSGRSIPQDLFPLACIAWLRASGS